MEEPEQGSASFRWVRLPVKLPPSKPISERWFSRRRVGIVAVSALLVFYGIVHACGPPAPEPGSVTPNQLEAMSRLNDFRPTNLVPTGELMVKAQDWSEKMADDGRLSHSDITDGVTPGWTAVGENVAYATTLEEAQTALENSAPHRSNMLNPAFTEAGVGVVWRNGQYWLTQNFADH